MKLRQLEKETLALVELAAQKEMMEQEVPNDIFVEFSIKHFVGGSHSRRNARLNSRASHAKRWADGRDKMWLSRRRKGRWTTPRITKHTTKKSGKGWSVVWSFGGSQRVFVGGRVWSFRMWEEMNSKMFTNLISSRRGILKCRGDSKCRAKCILLVVLTHERSCFQTKLVQ